MFEHIPLVLAQENDLQPLGSGPDPPGDGGTETSGADPSTNQPSSAPPFGGNFIAQLNEKLDSSAAKRSTQGGLFASLVDQLPDEMCLATHAEDSKANLVTAKLGGQPMQSLSASTALVNSQQPYPLQLQTHRIQTVRQARPAAAPTGARPHPVLPNPQRPQPYHVNRRGLSRPYEYPP